MRFFRFGHYGEERPGAFDDLGIARDISQYIPDLEKSWLDPQSLRSFASRDLTLCPEVDPNTRFGACVASVGNFLAVGLNYRDHAAESGMAVPSEPVVFNKAPSCVVGPNDDIRLPPNSQKTDWEVELAVVIGAEAYQLNEADVEAAIAGYCICNDVSEREYQLERGGGQWTKGKGCPTFGPLGPWLVTPDEIPDVQSLQMSLDLNGNRMQQGTTANMVFGVNYLVAHISKFMTLRPGDVITTGTPPGVGLGQKPPRYLKAGDSVSLRIDGLGEQTQHVC